MADRNWDRELQKIDKQIGSLPDEPTASSSAGSAPARPDGVPPAKATKAERPSAVPNGRPTNSLAVYARLTISVALGIGMLVWPYPSRCGAGLAGYLAAVAVVVTSGVWSAIWTWRHRASRAHTLSLLLILWGLVLGSMEVLPRVGYAKPDLNHPSTWACQ